MAILKVANVHHDPSGFTRTQVSSPNTISFVTSDQTRVTFSNTGNVGIGTTNPRYALDIVGAVNASSILLNGDSVSATANSYAATVGAAANGWANTISATRAAASNTYAVSVGAGANSYAATVGAASNTYTITVGVASNNWANTISATRAAASNTYADTKLANASITLNGTLRTTSLGVGTAASATTGEIRASNNITAYFSSDARLKEDVRDIQNAVDIVYKIGGKYFNWTNEYIEQHGGEDGYFIRKADFGVIAQDVESVFPIAVRQRSDGTLAVDYEKLVALAFAAIKELKDELNKIKGNE